jgi:hypothetical protein
VVESGDNPISENPRQSAAKSGRNWGGPRPGSGAPKGNLNALKHGRYSKQQANILAALIEVPQARDALIAIARRNHQRRKEAEEGAGVFLTTLLEKAAALALRSSSPLPQGDLDPPKEEGQGVRADDQDNNQDMNNQDFLDFLNTATAHMRKILEKQPTKRRVPIKRRGAS